MDTPFLPVVDSAFAFVAGTVRIFTGLREIVVRDRFIISIIGEGLRGSIAVGRPIAIAGSVRSIRVWASVRKRMEERVGSVLIAGGEGIGAREGGFAGMRGLGRGEVGVEGEVVVYGVVYGVGNVVADEDAGNAVADDGVVGHTVAGEQAETDDFGLVAEDGAGHSGAVEGEIDVAGSAGEDADNS